MMNKMIEIRRMRIRHAKRGRIRRVLRVLDIKDVFQIIKKINNLCLAKRCR